MKYGILIFVLLLLFAAAGCVIRPQEPQSIAPIEETEDHSTVTVDFDIYNGDTTVESYTLTGTDAAYLTALLQQLPYDSMKVCKCVPPIIVTLENGEKYGINTEEVYARSWSAIPQGQANLTEEQLNKIQAIFERMKNESRCSIQKKIDNIKVL